MNQTLKIANKFFFRPFHKGEKSVLNCCQILTTVVLLMLGTLAATPSHGQSKIVVSDFSKQLSRRNGLQDTASMSKMRSLKVTQEIDEAIKKGRVQIVKVDVKAPPKSAQQRAKSDSLSAARLKLFKTKHVPLVLKSEIDKWQKKRAD